MAPVRFKVKAKNGSIARSGIELSTKEETTLECGATVTGDARARNAKGDWRVRLASPHAGCWVSAKTLSGDAGKLPRPWAPEAVRVPCGGGDGSFALEGLLTKPSDVPKVAVLCPHANPGNKFRVPGSTANECMTSPLLEALAEELADRGAWVLRFNFKGVGNSDGAELYDASDHRTYPTHPTGIEDTQAALDWLLEQIPEGTKVVTAGFSMGSSMARQMCLGPSADRVSGWISFSLACDAYKFMGGAGGAIKAFTDDAFATLADREALEMCWINGTRDPMSPVASVEKYAAAMKRKPDLHFVEGKKHHFDDDGQMRACAIYAADWLKRTFLS